MNFEHKKKILYLIEKAINYAYPVRWADNKTTLGDFDGRNFTIDVFRIPASQQLDFLTTVEPVRDKIRELIGNRGIFIFHSPAATSKHYSHLFPRTEGVYLENTKALKLPLPNIGGTDGKPSISGSEVGIYIKFGKAA